MRGAGFFIAVVVVTVITGGCCVVTDIASWPFDPDTHSTAALHLTKPVALVPGAFMAGVAKVDVTPPVGVPLAGFGGSRPIVISCSRPTTGP